MIPGQHICVDVEQARAAIGAKMPPAMFRGFVDLGLPLGHLDRILCVHGPADDRRAGVTSAITAVTQRMDDEFALDLIADGATMTAASDVTHALLRSMRALPFRSIDVARMKRSVIRDKLHRPGRDTRIALRFIRATRLAIYADFLTALSTSVLPSDQIAPGTLWLAAMTSSNDFSIQLQSSCVITSGGSSLMVWLPWPETCVRIL